MEKRLSIFLGLLIGCMLVGEVLMGNLGGTSVFGNLRDSAPRLYALAAWFAVGAVSITVVTTSGLRTWIARGETALPAPTRKPGGGTR